MTRYMTDIIKTNGARRSWNDIFMVLKQKSSSAKILYLVKKLSQNEGKHKSHFKTKVKDL